MEQWLVPIVVALIGGPIVVMMQKLRKETKETNISNSADHANVMDILNVVAKQINQVDEKLDEHISWHFRKPKKKV